MAKSRKSASRTPVHIRGRAGYEALSPIEQEAYHRAHEAISEMRRENLSLRAAALRVGTTPENVRRYAGGALVKEGKRYKATPADRSYLRMSVLSTDGLREIDTRGSRVRSLVSRHWIAVGKFLATGDVAVLVPFKGKRVGGVELATDPDLIEEYGRQGELDIDDIYV